MYSFDVFDTLITRRTATPQGIFRIMEKKIQVMDGFDSFLGSNFHELRVGAEELARRLARADGKKEITLDDIYRTLASTSSMTETQMERLKELEVETEYANILAIHGNIARMKELKAQGKPVVLISDMYLGEARIRRMLCKVDPVFREIPLYVSSDHGKIKGNGGLYRTVKSREGADVSDWIHHGDNEHADIGAASGLGIKTVHLAPEAVKEYEQPQKDLYHQFSIGVSRYIRRMGIGNVAGEVGCSLAGPILYPYVSWVLKESLKREIDRLYFVSRDGWILWQIADVIIKAEGYPIKTQYIYGSRKAWRLPSFDGSKEGFETILRYSNLEEVLCLKDLAEVFQIGTEELKKALPEEAVGDAGEEGIAKYRIDDMLRRLRENNGFRESIVREQEPNRTLIVRYLRQEMDVSDDRFAFVELSGTGFTQQCLARIMKSFYNGKVRNFFYRLDGKQGEGQCRFIQFYPSDLKRYMLELLCRAPHGQVEGYEEGADGIVPVLERSEGDQIRAYHIEEYRDAVLAYAEGMEQAYMQNGLDYVEDLAIIKEYMDVISERPPKRIGEYFSHMPFSSGGRKNSMVEFAPAVSKKQLRKIYFWNSGENYRNVYKGDFLEYAFAVSDDAAQYKEKCQEHRKRGIGKWVADMNRYLHTRQRPGTRFFCPWELLKGSIVIYGAGQVGQDYVKQAGQRYARCDRLLWVDGDHVELRASGLDVRSPEEIRGYSFDRIIIAVHNDRVRQEIWEKLREMGIEAGKIYYG